MQKWVCSINGVNRPETRVLLGLCFSASEFFSDYVVVWERYL